MTRAAPVLFLLLASCILHRASAAQRPNIVLLLADDLGYADLNFLPQSPPDISTPNLDRLAKSGLYFTEAYATSPICSPSRVGLITGRYQQRWGNYWYGQGGLPKSELTLPQFLAKNGYSTKKIGKTHTNGGLAAHPLDHGFEEFLGFLGHTKDYTRLSARDVNAYGAKNARAAHIGPLERNRGQMTSYENDYSTDIFTNEAVEFISRDHKKKPFYLHLAYNAVHHPTYLNKPAYAAKFGFQDPLWNRDKKPWKFPYWDPDQETYRVWHKKWGHLGAVDPLGRKRYLASLHGLDLSVGRVLDALEKKGLTRNTIIVFLSDNGGTINTYSNNSPLRGYKYMFGEGGIRVPMIISWPDTLPNGRTAGGLVSAMDIFPTLAELIGAKTPDKLDGKSFRALLSWDTTVLPAPPHQELCWSDGKKDWVIRRGAWKLINSSGWDHEFYKLDQGTAKPAPNYKYPAGLLLFNLENDVAETTNLAAKHPARVKELQAAYQKWRAQMGKPVPGTRTPK
jgi:arylsulfatase A-like enzyme